MSELNTYVNGQGVIPDPSVADQLEIIGEDGERLVVRVGKSVERVRFERDKNDHKSFEIFLKGRSYKVQIKDRTDLLLEEMGMDAAVAEAAVDLKAPMPGLVVKTLVEKGGQVAKGDPLLVLEAMKMENLIRAQGEAEINEILVKSGDTVEKGQLMITFK